MSQYLCPDPKAVQKEGELKNHPRSKEGHQKNRQTVKRHSSSDDQSDDANNQGD